MYTFQKTYRQNAHFFQILLLIEHYIIYKNDPYKKNVI